MIKIFLKHFFIIIIVALLQVDILPNLSDKLGNMDVILVVLIFTAVVYRFYLSVIYGLILGFYIDLYSLLPFGATLLSYMLVLYLVYLIFKKILTNKSFYSLLSVMFIGTLIYNIFLYLFRTLFYFWDTKDYLLLKNYTIVSAQNLVWQLLLNLLLVIFLFVGFHLWSQKFKAVFIDTTKN